MSSIGKTLTASDFPASLVDAVGNDRIDQFNQIILIDLDKTPLWNRLQSGPVKGTDQEGRVFLSFLVQQEKVQAIFSIFTQAGEENVAITLLQPGRSGIKTSGFSHPMSEERYVAIKDLFCGKYPGLRIKGF
jgi:hypothetical protein